MKIETVNEIFEDAAAMEAFNAKVKSTLESDDPNKLAKMQLEVAWAQMEYLRRIDWKIWEIYTKFVR